MRLIRLVPFLLMVFLLLCAGAKAQQGELVVTGKVLDTEKIALPFSSVRAFHVADSSFVNGTVTGNDGTFSIQFSEGNYYLEVGFIGLQAVKITLSKRTGNIDLGTIVLKNSSAITSEVSVIADKSIAELKLDKRVYNV